MSPMKRKETKGGMILQRCTNGYDRTCSLTNDAVSVGPYQPVREAKARAHAKHNQIRQALISHPQNHVHRRSDFHENIGGTRSFLTPQNRLKFVLGILKPLPSRDSNPQ